MLEQGKREEIGPFHGGAVCGRDIAREKKRSQRFHGSQKVQVVEGLR